VGTAAIQLGRAAGAKVSATVRNEQLRAGVAALGARVLEPEGFAEHGPFDLILELIGAPNLVENLQALATRGRIAVIGVSAGAKSELNLLALMGKRARIHGSTLRARPLEEKALCARLIEREVLPLFENGELHVPVAQTFPLDATAEAYDRFAAGGKLGKIVLVM
jgi:NADPH:quinone reductase-like Zn-dependent oxidoreductase